MSNTSVPVASAATGAVAYEAELEIDPTRLNDVEAWLPGHVAELLRLPGFLSVESFRAGETADGWVRRKNVYRLASREHLDNYLQNIAPEMSARLRASFGDSVRASRKMLIPAPLSTALTTTVAWSGTGQACLNCGAPLTAEYCNVCGQRHEPHIHTVWHFTREATENLTHADSRFWRTLWALVAKPGFLTREFFAGRRARYLPPVRLYLVISILFFLLAGVLPSEKILQFDNKDGRADSAQELESKAAELEQAAAAGAAKPGDTGSEISAGVQRSVAASLRESAAEMRANEKSTTETAAAAKAPKVPANETREQRAERECRNMNYNGPWKATLEPRIQAGCRQTVMDGGKALGKEFMHNAPRAIFVLLPLLALVMKLLYWRPKRYYVEHLLYFIHVHAAMFVAFALLILTSSVARLEFLSSVVGYALLLYLPWYLYKSMRVTYRQSRMMTLAKFSTLSVVYITLASLVAAFALIYSVAVI
jgi:Protein of unknown function (DUF3667)/Domain of unknown function (DUF4286)